MSLTVHIEDRSQTGFNASESIDCISVRSRYYYLITSCNVIWQYFAVTLWVSLIYNAYTNSWQRSLLDKTYSGVMTSIANDVYDSWYYMKLNVQWLQFHYLTDKVEPFQNMMLCSPFNGLFIVPSQSRLWIYIIINLQHANEFKK